MESLPLELLVKILKNLTVGETATHRVNARWREATALAAESTRSTMSDADIVAAAGRLQDADSRWLFRSLRADSPAALRRLFAANPFWAPVYDRMPPFTSAILPRMAFRTLPEYRDYHPLLRAVMLHATEDYVKSLLETIGDADDNTVILFAGLCFGNYGRAIDPNLYIPEICIRADRALQRHNTVHIRISINLIVDAAESNAGMTERLFIYMIRRSTKVTVEIRGEQHLKNFCPSPTVSLFRAHFTDNDVYYERIRILQELEKCYPEFVANHAEELSGIIPMAVYIEQIPENDFEQCRFIKMAWCYPAATDLPKNKLASKTAAAFIRDRYALEGYDTTARAYTTFCETNGLATDAEPERLDIPESPEYEPTPIAYSPVYEY